MVVIKTPTSPVTGEKPFKILYELPPGTNTVILIGGRGGMKTYEASKFIAQQSTIKEKRCVILRDEKSLIRESILNEVLIRYDTANKNGQLDANFQRLDSGIKIKATNEMAVFAKGFRASAKAKKANLKSISNIDIALIEEMEDIRDEDMFNTFADSIRNEGSLIIMVLNTPDINHFVIKRYFNLSKPALPEGWTERDLDGFFDITPKDLPGFVCVKTGFEDNPYLPAHIVSRYHGYGQVGSNFYNPFYFKTAIKGWASTGRKGQILIKVKPIKREAYMALPFKEIYGQDFGTAKPAGTVGVKFDGNNCYVRQMNYLPKNVLDIGKMYCQLQLTDNDVIVADSAEPLSIGKLRNGFPADELSAEDKAGFPKLLQGFNVYGVIKEEGSIKYGLDLMDQLTLYVVEEDLEFWQEIINYVYATDKNGNYTGDPIDDFNHLIDPWRYVVMSRGRYF